MQVCKLSRPMESGGTSQMNQSCFFSIHGHTWGVEASIFFPELVIPWRALIDGRQTARTRLGGNALTDGGLKRS